MSSKADTHSHLDTLKLAAAAVILTAAVAAFYYFSEQSLLARVVGLLAAAGVAVFIAVNTAIGGALMGFVQDSRGELRKVVWPTRAETLQTTLLVIVMVIIMGIFLWLLDMLLFWIVRSLTG